MSYFSHLSFRLWFSLLSGSKKKEEPKESQIIESSALGTIPWAGCTLGESRSRHSPHSRPEIQSSSSRVQLHVASLSLLLQGYICRGSWLAGLLTGFIDWFIHLPVHSFIPYLYCCSFGMPSLLCLDYRKKVLNYLPLFPHMPISEATSFVIFSPILPAF